MANAPELPGVLAVSKPVAPPWNDSGKNLVRDVVSYTPGYRFHVMTTRGAEPPADGVVTEPIYGDPGSYKPSLRQNLRVLRRLLRPDKLAIYHYFFAPNPRTSSMARLVGRFKRRRVVHTVSSRPAELDAIGRLMFADSVVALSEHTRAALEGAGVPGVVHIPPCVPEAAPMTAAERRAVRDRHGLDDAPVVLYAGDYEFSGAARAVAEAAARLLRERRATVVFACRPKTAEAAAGEAAIRSLVTEAGVGERVVFLQEVDDMRGLVAAADVHVQPAGSLYAKMDLPLVLLESLREGVPVVLGASAPLDELLVDEVGLGVPPEDGEALAAAVTRLLDDDGLRARFGENARRAAAERYSPRRMGEAYAALYLDLLEGR